jgi:hypothetical protein
LRPELFEASPADPYFELVFSGGITLFTSPNKRVAKYSGGGQMTGFGELMCCGNDSENGICDKFIINKETYRKKKIAFQRLETRKQRRKKIITGREEKL